MMAADPLIRASGRSRAAIGRLRGAAMTTLHASKGRRVKFTPQVIKHITDLVAQGVNRHEIANRFGVTVGSLQVTCSRLGISLRTNGLGRHLADVRGRTAPTPCSVDIAHAEQKEISQSAARTAPAAHFAITMRLHGKEKTTHIPLPSPAIELLALEATSRNLDIAALIGQVLIAAINKDMIDNILR
jgi:hypothetical protein